MTDKKKTMYEVLEVPPNASTDEIRAAHRRLTQSLASGKPPMSPEQMQLRRQVLNLALDTLSNEGSRNAYDAKLASRAPYGRAAPRAGASLVPQALDARTLTALASLEEARSRAASRDAILPPSATVMASAVDKSASALWKILRLVALALVVIILIKAASLIMAGRQPRQPGGPLTEAEEKVMIQEYYQQHGVRPGSKAELDLLEIERQRKLNEERAAALEKKKEEDSYRKFVEDSRRVANQVSAKLQRDEEIARRQAEQEKRKQEYEQRRAEEAERNYIRQQRRKLGLPGDPR